MYEGLDLLASHNGISNLRTVLNIIIYVRAGLIIATWCDPTELGHSRIATK
jgi:hypothetical protein